VPKKILVVCATSIATSTHIANKLREICKENGIDAVVTQAKAMECIPKASRLSEECDLVVATVEMPQTCAVPVVQGAAFISGIGERQTIETIVKLLKEE
jgi:PTS system galactitol-specific IIB component